MRRRHLLREFDPVRDYDGLCQYGRARISPEEMTEKARAQMMIMEESAIAQSQDEQARQTPIGGMQFR